MFAALGAVPRVVRESELREPDEVDSPFDLRRRAIPNSNDTAGRTGSRHLLRPVPVEGPQDQLAKV